MEMDTQNGNLNKYSKNGLKRGAALGGICAAVASVVLFLFQENLTAGAATAAVAVIPV